MTGLEPAAFCVTGRRSNQLSYNPNLSPKAQRATGEARPVYTLIQQKSRSFFTILRPLGFGWQATQTGGFHFASYSYCWHCATIRLCSVLSLDISRPYDKKSSSESGFGTTGLIGLLGLFGSSTTSETGIHLLSLFT